MDLVCEIVWVGVFEPMIFCITRISSLIRLRHEGLFVTAAFSELIITAVTFTQIHYTERERQGETGKD